MFYSFSSIETESVVATACLFSYLTGLLRQRQVRNIWRTSDSLWGWGKLSHERKIFIEKQEENRTREKREALTISQRLEEEEQARKGVCRVGLSYTSGQVDALVADRSGEEMCPRWKVHSIKTTSCLLFLLFLSLTASAPRMTNPNLQAVGSVTNRKLFTWTLVALSCLVLKMTMLNFLILTTKHKMVPKYSFLQDPSIAT